MHTPGYDALQRFATPLRALHPLTRRVATVCHALRAS
jgi:hypothetical protein